MADASRIRILIIQPECHDRSHDSNDLVEQIIRGFPKDRYEVTSLFFQGAPDSRHPPSAADKVVYFDLPDSALKGMRLRLRHRLLDYCRQHDFHVVICNRYKPVSLVMQSNRWLGIPLCIGISHGIGEYKGFWRRRLARWFIDPRWRFVGVSSAVSDYLLRLDCGFTAANTLPINNALDIDATQAAFLSPEAARDELGLARDDFVMGSIGRLVRVKGHVFLLRAFARLHREFPAVRLMIIGDGKEEEGLRQEAAQLGIADKLILPGFRSQAARYARAFDLWVMPSLSEGLPRALLEGMCAGLPVVTSAIPALKPIAEGAGGVAVPAGNVDALSEGLRHYLAMPAAGRLAAGRKAYAYLREHFDLEAYQQSYRRLVEDNLPSTVQGKRK